ncbi:MAG: phenylalanine--tRNA ligase subunit beta [Hadesarchaea archaeon]|nr:phenylalanine--tRNA ligase subunit beta [Hadesarchaea archaeon]
MPTINIDPNDLSRLLGEDYSLEDLEPSLQNLGMEVEGITQEELKLEVPHNRSDLFSVEGVARSLKGYLDIETGRPNYEVKKPTIEVKVDSSIEKTRPIIVAGMIENIKFNDASLKALMDLQEKLHQILGRDRNKISIGTYDLDKAKPPIKYTTVKPNEIKFVPLEFKEELTPAEILEKHPKGIEYSHLIEEFDRYPLLVDSEDQVLSMPPIINSESNRVTKNTERLMIDVTGINENVAREALKVIMTASGERNYSLRAVKINHHDGNFWTPNTRTVRRKLSIENANEKLGLNLSPKEASGIMERMRYDVEEIKEDRIYVRVPLHRSDIMHEVDLIEDLGIGFGYDKLEPSLPPVLTTGEVHPIEKISRKARRVLTGLGFTEVMTFVLTNPELNFDSMRIENGAATISNPISEEYSILRTWLLPGLMSVLQENKHHELPQKIFEVGDVVSLTEETETKSKNIRRAAGAIAGEDANFTYAKAVAESLLRELGLNWEIESFEHESFIHGRVAKITNSNGEKIGVVGEIHPEILLNFELEHPVAGFEIDLPEQRDFE